MPMLVLTAVLGLVVGNTALAKEPSDIKIGYVDLNLALNQVEEGKEAKKKLTNDFEGKQKQIDKMKNDLKAKQSDFESRSAMMKPEVKAAKQDELQREFMELQKTYMQLQQDLIDRETKITQEIGGKLRRVIERIGDRDGYTLVLNIGDTVLYHKRHRDLTDEVVRDYNDSYGTNPAAGKK